MTREQARLHKANTERLERQLAIVANPETPESRMRRASRWAAALAEKLGIIERPSRCEWCRRREVLERHHPRHDMPLHVTFLCAPCHALADRMDGTSRDGPGESRIAV